MKMREQMRQEFLFFKKNKGLKEHLKFKKWILDNGESFTKIDKVLSMKLSKMNDCKIKECYRNALMSDLTGKYRFFEGWIWSKQIPIMIEHAWLVDGNKVIDPTMIISPDGRDRVKDMEWFGVELPRKFVQDKTFKSKVTDSWLASWFLEKQEVK